MNHVLSSEEKFERKLIHHCTPTLAALKPANLFTCRIAHTTTAQPHHTSAPACSMDDSHPDTCRPTTSMTEEDLSHALHVCRSKLEPCGVRIEVLARRTSGVLIYVYRPTQLTRAIQQENVQAFLADEGYDTSSLSACIKRLHERICGTDVQSQITGRCSFPHEIGFFLGYPYEDVIGFIQNKGENFLCCGCWKVYTQERDAQACFCRYKNCTTVYKCLFDEGIPLEQLANVDENSLIVQALRIAS